MVIDTREKRPYRFKDSVRGTLRTGDYSLLGYEEQVAIERKSKTDAYTSLGAARRRFQREMERLGQLRYAAVVVESTVSGFLLPPVLSRMNPRSAIASLLSWSVRYGVHIFFAGDRKHGNNITRVLLDRYWVHHQGEHRG